MTLRIPRRVVGSAVRHLGLLRGLGPEVGASSSLLLVVVVVVAVAVEGVLGVVVDLMVDVVVVDGVEEEERGVVVSGQDMRFQSSWDLQVVGAVFDSDVAARRKMRSLGPTKR